MTTSHPSLQTWHFQGAEGLLFQSRDFCFAGVTHSLVEGYKYSFQKCQNLSVSPGCFKLNPAACIEGESLGWWIMKAKQEQI